MASVRRALAGAVIAPIVVIAFLGGVEVVGRFAAWTDARLGIWPNTTAVLLFVALLGAFFGVFFGALDASDRHDLPPPPPPPERD